MGLKLAAMCIACVATAVSVSGQGSSQRLNVAFPQGARVVPTEGGTTGIFSYGSVTAYAVPSARPCQSITDDFVRGALADAPLARSKSFLRGRFSITSIFYPNGASGSVSTVCLGDQAMIVSGVFKPTSDDAVVDAALRDYLSILSSVRHEGQPPARSPRGGSWEVTHGLSDKAPMEPARVTAPDPATLPQLLIRTWTFDKGAGITGTIEFYANGTYHYQVGVGRAWRVEHVGNYTIVPANDPFRVLDLRPTRIMSAGSADAAWMLGRRRMMDNDPHEFYILSHGSGLMLADVQCGAACVQTWTITPDPTRP